MQGFPETRNPVGGGGQWGPTRLLQRICFPCALLSMLISERKRKKHVRTIAEVCCMPLAKRRQPSALVL